MSNVPSGQVAAFPALTLDMQCVLVDLRSKTSLNRYEARPPSQDRDENAKGGNKYQSVLALIASAVEAGGEEKPLREDYKLAKPNYSGEKRRKDLAKKAKKEEKRLRKLQARQNPASEEAEVAEADNAIEETKEEG
jgi:hypothetical protein